MKRTKVILGISIACGLLLCPALRAQNLPATNGLLLWLNADAGVTTNASGQVTQWADASGLGNHAFQTTAANAPTLAAASLNGHATLRFVSPQFLEVPNSGGIDTLENDVTVLTVARYDNLSGFRGVVSKCTGGVGSPFDWWNNASDNGGRTAFWLGNGTASANVRSTIAPPTGVFNVLGFRWKDGAVDQFLNDFNIGSGTITAVPANGATNLRIGRRQDGTPQLVGNVAEILIYKPALSDAQIYSVVNDYFRPKYGLVFNIASTVSITSPANGGSTAAPALIPVSVSASDTDGYVARLSVYGNGVLLGTGSAVNTNSASSYQLEIRAQGQGPLTLTAVATDNYGQSSTSAPVVVNLTATLPALPATNGLKLWLAGDAGVSANAGGFVTEWSDQSGAANHAVSLDETTAPQTIPNAVNGKPVLRFAGDASAGQFLEVSDPGTAFLTGDFTTYAVARFVGSYPALRQHIWSKCGGGVAGPVDWWFNTGNGLPTGYRGDGAFFAGTGSGTRAPVLGQYTTVGMTVTAVNGSMAHHLGFADVGASIALTNTANAGPFRIGRRADNGTQINGDIAEILVYDRALSATERSNVVGYLAAKYALTESSYASSAPALSITSPTNGSTFSAPSRVLFSATASSSQGVISRVTLAANGTTFATLTNPPYQVPLDLLTPGSVTFTAVAQDNWGIQTTNSVTATVTGTASTPPVTNGLRLWLAADVGVSANPAGAVTSWNDQSPDANHAAPTEEATAPLLVPNVLNGKPVLRFSGGTPGQFLEAPGDTSFTAGDISSFAIVRFNNFSGTPAFRTIWTKTANNNLAAPVDWYFASGSGAANLFRGNGAAGGFGGVAGGAAPAGAFTVVGFKASGQAITHYLGYNITGSGNISQVPVDGGFPLRIGRRYDGGVQMNGDIAEILIYDRAVSESDRLQIANYLYNKYGLTVVRLANVAPTVTITSPTNQTTLSVGEGVSVTAQAADPDSPISQVDFLANGAVLLSRTAPPYAFPLQALTPGNLTLQAQVTDIWGATGTSAPVTLTIIGSGPALPPSAGQVLWLKADSGVTTNADGTVATWADQSGNANHAAQDSTLGYPSPVLLTDTNTGRAALSFDGTIRYLTIPSASTLALTNDWSLFYAASFEDFAAARSICGKTTIALPHPFDYFVDGSAVAQVVRGDERSLTAIPSMRMLPAQKYVVAGVTVQGSLGSHFLQGLPNGTGQFSYGAIDDGTPLLIGTRDALDIYFKGYFGEIMLFNRALTGADLEAVNSYLAGKYGVATARVFTAPPTLAVTRTGPTLIQLSWPASYAGFTLEGRTNLASGTWASIVSDPPGNQVSINTTNAAQFFRLRSQ